MSRSKNDPKHGKVPHGDGYIRRPMLRPEHIVRMLAQLFDKSISRQHPQRPQPPHVDYADDPRPPPHLFSRSRLQPDPRLKAVEVLAVRDDPPTKRNDGPNKRNDGHEEDTDPDAP